MLEDDDNVHWDRDTYREAQQLYANIKHQIAVLQSLNAKLYRRIRAARKNYQEEHAEELAA